LNVIRTLAMLVLALGLSVAVVGCKKESPVEQATDAVNQAEKDAAAASRNAEKAGEKAAGDLKKAIE